MHIHLVATTPRDMSFLPLLVEANSETLRLFGPLASSAFFGKEQPWKTQVRTQNDANDISQPSS